MSSAIDLTQYFDRINYKGPQKPTYAVLKELVAKHTETIPFENLNPLLGLPVKLDLDSLQQKMVQNQRGGYCYEQNLLLLHVLKAIGYQAKGLAARIRWNKADDEITPRSHMLISIDIDSDTYLADVGFGSQTLTGPLLLETGTVQETPHESRRLIRDKGKFVMQTLIKEEWKSIYEFNLQENFLPDYEVYSWYLSNHPESHFVTGLIAARPAPGVRYTLQDTTFSTYYLDGTTEKRILGTVSDIREVLETRFSLSLPEESGLDDKLTMLID